MLTHLGLVLNKDDIKLKEIKNKAIFISKTYSSKKIIKLFYSGHNKFVFPKFIDYKFLKLAKQKKTLTERNKFKTHFEFKENFNLTKYQKLVNKELQENFLVGKEYGGATVVMPCGSGKTIFALNFAINFGYKTLIIVPRRLIAEQWISEGKKILKNSKQIYFINAQNLTQIKNIDIAVCTSQFILNVIKKCKHKYFDSFRHIIFDEVHHMSAEMLINIPKFMHFNFSLGLTATPKRIDGTEKIFYDYIGKKIKVSYGRTFKKNDVIVKGLQLKRTPIINGKSGMNYTKMISDLT